MLIQPIRHFEGSKMLNTLISISILLSLIQLKQGIKRIHSGLLEVRYHVAYINQNPTNWYKHWCNRKLKQDQCKIAVRWGDTSVCNAGPAWVHHPARIWTVEANCYFFFSKNISPSIQLKRRFRR